VFLGESHAGDSIDLGDFKLSVIQQYGPPKIEPINPATRILFFLQRAKNSATLWKLTYFEESYFWVQRTEDVALLKRAAERAKYCISIKTLGLVVFPANVSWAFDFMHLGANSDSAVQ
jgi:hypothetical protein